MKKITDVSEVIVTEIELPNFSLPLLPEANSSESSENTKIVIQHKQIKTNINLLQEKLQPNEIENLKNQSIKLFHINLSLSDEVLAPEEQFYNLLASLNEYIGRVVDSSPSLEELNERKELLTPIPTLSNLIETESSQAHHAEAKTRRRIEFILLINGNHKNILDFLSDACEINQVEVKEIKYLGASQPQLESPLEEKPQTALPENTNTGENLPKQNDVKTSFVRVNLGTLESLMNAVGELVINHNRIRSTMAENPSNEILSITQYLHQVTTKIQQLLMSIRMVPVNQVFSRFPRFIRDVSRELKKEVDLRVEGEQTEIDRILIDELYEIFVHLVRNAIDHGLETEEERLAKGKPKVGVLKMQAYPQGNNVLVSVSDDGKGMDVKRIKQKALEKKLITKAQADLLNEEDTLNLIFTSGFSTADQISDLSGRGVGMDVVKAKVTSLGGQVFLTSKPGEGTTFKLSIPSTISIIQVLLVENNGLYAIPLAEIKEIVSLANSELHKIGPCNVIILHKETIPLINLSRYLASPKEQNQAQNKNHNQDGLVVIFQSEGKSYGMLVNSLVGQQEIVIKPISSRANKQGLVNGATVFGDGRIAMILNVDKIVKLYLKDYKEFILNIKPEEPEPEKK